ncbi:MAG: hypothetical protein KBC21_03715 [Candidatus Pacebacteria bacterium]|nr:hypothetical protein [Candidatus Paceibacterota bacterium]
MSDFDWQALGLSHPPCQTLVEVPTIRVQERGYGYPYPAAEFAGQKEVVLQWYAQPTHDEELDRLNLQFAFPLMIRPDDVAWMGHPEWFHVVMVGTLELWPNKGAVQAIMRTRQWTMESTLVYVMTDKIKLDNGKGGDTNAAFLIGCFLFGDPAFGVIQPKTFENWKVSAEVNAALT